MLGTSFAIVRPRILSPHTGEAVLLDATTEARIKRALDRLREGRTTFIIAHRLSTVADADEILVFETGRIVERGRFEALARGKGLFARMVAEGGFTVPGAPEI